MDRDFSRPVRAGSHPTWTLVACVLASSLSFVEGSVLSVALPAIRASYGADAQQVQWVVNAYLLPLWGKCSFSAERSAIISDDERLLVIGTSIFAGHLAGLRAGAEPSNPARRTCRARRGSALCFYPTASHS